MNTWIRIVLVSVLALMLLEPAAIATGTAQENGTTWSGGYDGAHQRADLPLGDASGSSPIPVTPGGITAEAVSTQAMLAIVSGPSVSGVPIFPADHIWNTRVDSLPVDPLSAEYIGTIGSTAYLHADFGSGMYDGSPIGIPYNIVDGSQEKKTVLFDYADESDPGPYPIPDNPFIEGGSDHHMVIIDHDAKMLYELFAAEKQADGSWAAGSGAVFNLTDYTLRPAGWTSADAAGLAILPGLVRYDEVNAGEINHALRFTAPSTRRAYIWPARHYASSITDPAYPPMGQRFRLKSSFNTSGYPYQAHIVLEALKKYGMILSDNGAPWYITGVPDEQWNNDALHTLHQLKGSDFEAVDSSSLMINQDSGQALTHPVIPTTSHRIGLYRNGTWDLDDNGNGMWDAGTDTTYSFGAPGFTPVLGDWNGDGSTKIGVYKDGAWYLDYLGNGTWTTTTKAYSFGAPGFTPVIGNWNGDGRTKIGVYKDGAWYLDYLGNGTWTTTTKAYSFGAPGFTPVVGDWNGNGRTKIGVYKDGAWYLDYLGNGTWTSTTRAYSFGAPSFTPVVGDWNGDSRTKIGVYKGGAWYLDYLGEGTWTATTKAYRFGETGWTPLIGKWS